MIKIEPYTEEFQKTYWKTVKKIISSNAQKDILSSSQKFLPKEFWDSEAPVFKNLVLAPFEKLKRAREHLENPVNFQKMRKECYIRQPAGDQLKDFYQELVDAFEKVAKSENKGFSMRVRIVINSRLTVCPYCNRDYINCRAKNVSGAQLDHFFEKSDYPFFAVCLYNLVPVCGNCNRVKSKQNMAFASPFDEKIDWGREVVFDYRREDGDKIKIMIDTEHPDIKNNIEVMRIKEAYQIHDAEVRELLEKQKSYSKTQREEFREVLKGIPISDQEIKRTVFGPKITEEEIRTKPLGKMMSDLHKKLGIWDYDVPI